MTMKIKYKSKMFTLKVKKVQRQVSSGKEVIGDPKN